jgi:hypothetical protein
VDSVSIIIRMDQCSYNLEVAVSFPDEIIKFFDWSNPSSRIMALRVDSASNRNEYQESSWGKGWPTRKADNLTVIYELIV